LIRHSCPCQLRDCAVSPDSGVGMGSCAVSTRNLPASSLAPAVLQADAPAVVRDGKAALCACFSTRKRWAVAMAMTMHLCLTMTAPASWAGPLTPSHSAIHNRQLAAAATTRLVTALLQREIEGNEPWAPGCMQVGVGTWKAQQVQQVLTRTQCTSCKRSPAAAPQCCSSSSRWRLRLRIAVAFAGIGNNCRQVYACGCNSHLGPAHKCPCQCCSAV